MSDETPRSRSDCPRRRLMQGAAAVGVVAWIPFEQIPAAQAALPTPPSFPGGIPLYQQAYKNWSGDDRRRRRLDVHAEHARPTWSRWPTGRGPTAGGCAPRAARTTGRRSRSPPTARRRQRRARRHQDQA